MAIFNKSGGIRCEALDEAGEIHHCQVFKNGKGEKISTGTDITISVSKSNNCEPVYQGNFDIVDGDEDQINKIVEQKVKACRKGLA